MVRGTVAAVALLCVLASACSSTVQQSGQVLPADQGASASLGETAAGDTAGEAVVDGSNMVAAGGSGASTGPRSTAPAARSAATATSASGPVRVGVNYSENLGSIFASVGGVDSTDGEAVDSIRPIVEWINQNGGIAGRRLEAVLHGVNPTEGTFAIQEQEACAAFTEDTTVNAVVTGAAAMGLGLTSCLARKRVPVLLELHHALDDVAFRDHGGYLYQPFGISSERQGFFTDELAAAGYLANAKIGVLYADAPIMKRYLERVIRAPLAARGVSITAEFGFSLPGGASDAGSLFSQANNAVLKFRSAGVTHVITVPTGGALPFAFMPSAESQGYRPRYAMNSLEIPAFVDLNVPNAQLKDALAVGWLPTSDVLTPQRPTDNPAERLCFRITNSRSDIPSRYCEGLFFLKAAWDASGDVSPAGLQRGVRMLGDTWRSPWTFATRFGTGRADGAAAYRLVRFEAGCQCFSYTGPMKAIP